MRKGPYPTQILQITFSFWKSNDIKMTNFDNPAKFKNWIHPYYESRCKSTSLGKHHNLLVMKVLVAFFFFWQTIKSIKPVTEETLEWINEIWRNACLHLALSSTVKSRLMGSNSNKIVDVYFRFFLKRQTWGR